MSHVSPGPEPTEFRYRDDGGQARAVWALFVALLFLLSSVATGVLGIAELAHASWLKSGGLPSDDPTFWGIVLLGVATLQGLCGLLIFFSRRIGTVLGIGLAALGIVAHLLVISSYPILSVAGIAVGLLIIGLLVASRPGR